MFSVQIFVLEDKRGLLKQFFGPSPEELLDKFVLKGWDSRKTFQKSGNNWLATEKKVYLVDDHSGHGFVIEDGYEKCHYMHGLIVKIKVKCLSYTEIYSLIPESLLESLIEELNSLKIPTGLLSEYNAGKPPGIVRIGSSKKLS